MTGDRSKLTDLKETDYHEVTFGDSSKSKVIGIGNVGNKHITIFDVQLVTGLRYNILSISQLCDSGFKITFSPGNCSIFDQSGKLILECLRDHNVYTCDLDSYSHLENVCLVSNDDHWLWHHRLGHINMKLSKNISSKEHVRGLPKLKFVKDHTCEACELRK